MKPREFSLRPGESPEAAIGRLYRHIRRLQPDYKPQRHYASRLQIKKAHRHLRLVK
jgi:hypothetical protein